MLAKGQRLPFARPGLFAAPLPAGSRAPAPHARRAVPPTQVSAGHVSLYSHSSRQYRLKSQRRPVARSCYCGYPSCQTSPPPLMLGPAPSPGPAPAVPVGRGGWPQQQGRITAHSTVPFSCAPPGHCCLLQPDVPPGPGVWPIEQAHHGSCRFPLSAGAGNPSPPTAPLALLALAQAQPTTLRHWGKGSCLRSPGPTPPCETGPKGLSIQRPRRGAKFGSLTLSKRGLRPGLKPPLGRPGRAPPEKASGYMVGVALWVPVRDEKWQDLAPSSLEGTGDVACPSLGGSCSRPGPQSQAAAADPAW